MDLREHKSYAMRHPWEIARVRALKLLLKRVLDNELRVLDIGCGDGYVCSELFKDRGVNNITAVDIHLSDEQIREFSARGEQIRFLNDHSKVGSTRYDLVLLLDVLEHVKEDRMFLREISEKHVAASGWILITAPMYQALFSAHDTFLGHYRRYSLRGLAGLADAGGLQCILSGYLFTSLLLVRFLSAFFQKVLKRNFTVARGVGAWKHGPFVTNVIALLLTLDARLSLGLNRFNIKLPGLTGWVLCRKRQS